MVVYTAKLIMNVIFSYHHNHLQLLTRSSGSAAVRFPVCPSTLVAYEYDNINISGVTGVLTALEVILFPYSTKRLKFNFCVLY